MRFRPRLQPLETRDTPSGFIPEFDPPPVPPVDPDPGVTPGGDPTFGGPYVPPPPPDLGG